MSASAERIVGPAAVAGRRRPGPTVEPVPALAAGVSLLGEVPGSGYRRAPALVRRADGQTIQLTPLLYGLLQEIDGERSHDELAAALGERTGKLVTADDVRFLTEVKLRPLGLLREVDGSQPKVERANPLLALRLRFAVSDPDLTNRIAAPFTFLFRTPIVLAVVVGFALVIAWLAFEKGLASAARQALFEPELLLLALALTLLSAAFHELGHAAACRYSGAKPGRMGVGLYLIWPAFFTDVTDAYRLGRRGRLRVDLGGLYFNAIFGIGMVALWAAVRWDALLLVVAAQVIQMIRQLLPIVRFDGYHVLADLTGVPDLFHHIKPTLLGLLPTRWGRAEGKALKPWARAVVTGWVLVTVPLLATLLALMVVLFPRFAGTAWESVGLHWSEVQAGWAQADDAAVAVGAFSVLMVCLPIVGIAYLLGLIARRSTQRTWRATAGRPALRTAAALAGAVMVTGVAWAWWPGDQYRPIAPDERWRLFDVRGLPEGGAQPIAPVPVAAEAEAGHWELVLLPKPVADTVQASAVSIVAPAEALPQPAAVADPLTQWSLAFRLPPLPGVGDNQAALLNTQDFSAQFDVALALVWVTDGGPVDNRNEAYALASCTGCRTGAVAFQVVLVVGYAQVVTPINTAVAVNHLCTACATQALAVQLVTTLTRLPTEQAMAELQHVWTQLEAQSESFELLPLEQVTATLDAAQTAILDIVVRDGATVASATALAGSVVTAAETTTAATTAATTTTTETSEPETTSTTTTTTETSTEESTTTTEPAETTTATTSTTTTEEEPPTEP